MSDQINKKEYRVLARKYRPQVFKDLIGQEILVRTLTNSIELNRIAHAYLLTGVRGIGKTTTARLIAMSLNCEKRLKDSCEPCADCNSCISVREDRNLDVIEIDAASKTGVDDIREIIDNVKYKPLSSQYKIFIIDEVHMLSKNAFNALLKTLEEPPSHVKFIFATTEVKKIPITIISRCQRFDLHRITKEKLTSHLNYVSDREKIEIEKDAMALIVRSADGSMRDGLSLLDQAIVNEKEHITIDSVSKMLGLADKGRIFDLLDAIFLGNANNALEIYNSIYDVGADVNMIFDELLNTLHFITQIKISPEIKNDIHIPELERNKGFEISEKISLASIGLVWQVLYKGYEELQTGYHLFQHGEMIIIRLIYLYQGPTPDDLIKKFESEKNKGDNFIVRQRQSEDSEINKIVNNLDSSIKTNFLSEINVDEKKLPRGNISITSFREFVDLFYKKREAMLHTHLYNNVKLVSFKEGEVVLNSISLNDDSFTRSIARLASMWTGRIWQIIGSDSNIGNTLQEEDVIEEQKEIEKMKKNSIVENILNSFPGVKIHSITNINETMLEDENTKITKNEKEN